MQLHWSEHKAIDPILHLLKWVLAFIVAYQLAVLTWLIIDQPTVVLPEPSKSSAQSAVISEKQNMAALSLFGDAEQVIGSDQKEISAPKTRLRLALKGVFVATQSEQSSAIIAEQGREGEFF